VKTRKVVVLPYDPQWVCAFLKIKLFLEKALKNCFVSIEHVGSTSVEGLPAKPIIDIDVVIASDEVFREVKTCLEDIGYYHEGDLGIPGREAFAYSVKDEFMRHHLYICPQGSEELKRHIAFRDYLRANKSDAEKYGSIKLKAAKMFPTDIEKYMEVKSCFISEIHMKIF
jgi:GrpB-like predicted nucleotidyltransferase (UPF0157 family)